MEKKREKCANLLPTEQQQKEEEGRGGESFGAKNGGTSIFAKVRWVGGREGSKTGHGMNSNELSVHRSAARERRNGHVEKKKGRDENAKTRRSSKKSCAMTKDKRKTAS